MKEFIAYEYKEISGETNERLSFLIDGYESFGWEPDENISLNYQTAEAAAPSVQAQRKRVQLKRNRKILNKAELTRLQRNFEACVSEIDRMEKSQNTKGMIWAMSVGLVGTAFMAGAVFAVTANPPQVLLCILLALPAFAGWALPYFLFKKFSEEQKKKIRPLIEAKYDEIYELCEKGNKLLV